MRSSHLVRCNAVGKGVPLSRRCPAGLGFSYKLKARISARLYGTKEQTRSQRLPLGVVGLPDELENSRAWKKERSGCFCGGNYGGDGAGRCGRGEVNHRLRRSLYEKCA